MVRLVILSMFLGLALSSCKTDANDEQSDERAIQYGGTFTFSVGDQIGSLYPHSIKDVGAWQVACQIYEGLVKFSTSNVAEVVPGIADSWEINSERTEFTFHLNPEARFHDNSCFEGGKGRVVTAQDVKYTFELLCTNYPGNVMYNHTVRGKLLGAEDYYNGVTPEIAGIEVIDDNTIKLTTTGPSSTFLFSIANVGAVILAKEAVEAYGADCVVGCGPFMMTDEGDPSKEVILEKHPGYHGQDKDGNQLPYLDTVHIRFFSNKYLELDEFQAGNLSLLIGLPPDKITDMLSDNTTDFNGDPPKYFLSHGPEMSTQYYTFNLKKEQFQDVRVRQALSLALNREEIVNGVLHGEAFLPGYYGITPPIFDGLDTAYIGEVGYRYDPERARQLLAEAGYANGNGFPAIQLKVNTGGAMNYRVASEISKQWMKELGIVVDIDQSMNLTEKIEAEEAGEGDIFRNAWIAEIPDPESFLVVGYAGGDGMTLPDGYSGPNTMPYVSATFDSLFMAGVTGATFEDRYSAFAEAERIMLQDCPIIVLWYTDNFKILDANVWNFKDNAMNYIDLSTVFIKERTTRPTGADDM